MTIHLAGDSTVAPGGGDDHEPLGTWLVQP